jgi:hypothetical protein
VLARKVANKLSSCDLAFIAPALRSVMARWWWCQKTWLCLMVPENLLACSKWPASWKTPREGLMKIAASFPSVMKPRFNRPGGGCQYDWRWCPLAAWCSNKGAINDNLLARLQPVATWNLHTTQPNTLFPTYDEVVNLTGLLETKGMSVSSGKW